MRFVPTAGQSRTKLAPRLVVRIVGAVAGGYALTSIVTVLLALVLVLFGLSRSEATVLAMMLGFLVYLLVLLWAFSVQSLATLWLALLTSSGSAVLTLWALRVGTS